MDAYGDKKKDVHMVSIDLEKALDRVPRKLHWSCLERKDASFVYIRLIKGMYERKTMRIRMLGGDKVRF